MNGNEGGTNWNEGERRGMEGFPGDSPGSNNQG